MLPRAPPHLRLTRRHTSTSIDTSPTSIPCRCATPQAPAGRPPASGHPSPTVHQTPLTGEDRAGSPTGPDGARWEARSWQPGHHGLKERRPCSPNLCGFQMMLTFSVFPSPNVSALLLRAFCQYYVLRHPNHALLVNLLLLACESAYNGEYAVLN